MSKKIQYLVMIDSHRVSVQASNIRGAVSVAQRQLAKNGIRVSLIRDPSSALWTNVTVMVA